jgi:hypothetical protein
MNRGFHRLPIALAALPAALLWGLLEALALWRSRLFRRQPGRR